MRRGSGASGRSAGGLLGAPPRAPARAARAVSAIHPAQRVTAWLRSNARTSIGRFSAAPIKYKTLSCGMARQQIVAMQSAPPEQELPLFA